jgi:anti-sigma regulatory factor (Ser/Thr protein kinase)
MFDTAVIEIAANIIEHGSPGASAKCDLTIDIYPDRLDAHCLPIS